jgi:hypothetical protein
MRVSMLLLFCLLLCVGATSGQERPGPTWSGPMGTIAGGHNPSGANEYSLVVLERAAFLGQREASALLAVLLQDAGDVENNLVKSALHFQVALAAGCSDVGILAAHAVDRLSPEQRADYERQLPHWVPATGARPDPRLKGPCLTW